MRYINPITVSTVNKLHHHLTHQAQDVFQHASVDEVVENIKAADETQVDKLGGEVGNVMVDNFEAGWKKPVTGKVVRKDDGLETAYFETEGDQGRIWRWRTPKGLIDRLFPKNFTYRLSSAEERTDDKTVFRYTTVDLSRSCFGARVEGYLADGTRTVGPTGFPITYQLRDARHSEFEIKLDFSPQDPGLGELEQIALERKEQWQPALAELKKTFGKLERNPSFPKRVAMSHSEFGDLTVTYLGFRDEHEYPPRFSVHLDAAKLNLNYSEDSRQEKFSVTNLEDASVERYTLLKDGGKVIKHSFSYQVPAR